MLAALTVQMDDRDISQMIDAELAAYTYDKPEPGSTLGEPWSEDKVLSYIPKLRRALVSPSVQKFLLQETYEQIGSESFADYWVIAEDQGYVQWFDPETQEYGLGNKNEDGTYTSIGVRGDLVGVYCAM